MSRRRACRAAVLAVVVGWAIGGAIEAKPRRGPARSPVVVELFTAQGCTACPQANALLQELVGKPGVIGLSFPVDLWDYLGWSDTLAQPEFAARQRAYAAHLKVREIYTPEIVVDGRREALGFERERVQGLIEAARRAPRAAPSLGLRGLRLHVGAATAAAAGELWLVRYDPLETTVKVTAGENKGKTIVEPNVVRELVRLGAWTKSPRTLALPPPKAEGLSTVVLLQAPRGGPILAVARG